MRYDPFGEPRDFDPGAFTIGSLFGVPLSPDNDNEMLDPFLDDPEDLAIPSSFGLTFPEYPQNADGGPPLPSESPAGCHAARSALSRLRAALPRGVHARAGRRRRAGAHHPGIVDAGGAVFLVSLAMAGLFVALSAATYPELYTWINTVEAWSALWR